MSTPLDELTLRRERDLLRQVMETSPAGIVVTDRQGQITFANRRAEQVLGLTKDEIIQRAYNAPTWRITDYDGNPFPDEALPFRRVLATSQPVYDVRHAIQWNDGRRALLAISGAPLFDQAGQVDGMVASVEDVTHQVQAEQALQQAKEYAENVIQTANVIFVQLNIRGEIVRMNAAAEQITGYRQAEVEGKNWFAVLAPKERYPYVWEEFSRISERGGFPRVFENPILTRSGEERYIIWQNSILREGDRVVGTISFGVDITERRRVEAALREREQQLSSMYDNASDVLFYLAVEPEEHFRFVSVNRNFLQATGLNENQIVGKLMQQVIPQPAHELVLGKYRQAIRERKTATWEEASVYPAGKRYGEVSVTPVFDPQGNCTHLIGTVHDVTERKRAEADIRQLNTELEQRVATRTAELAERMAEVEQLNRGMTNLLEDLQAANRLADESAQKLKAANKELESFSYSVSHDLKAPLRGIDGYSRLLLEDYADKLDDEGRRFLYTIRGAANQMSQLIDDLLAYSRLERRTLTPGRINPAALIEALLAERGDDLRARNVAVRVDIPCASVNADAEGLSQVLRNLLDNALKFTQGVPAPAIEFGGRATASSCIMWVADNGIGFDMQYHDRIFEIFQRLHRAEDYPGTGVGLAIVRKAMERMGGRVWAESELGKGATFFLEAPR